MRVTVIGGTGHIGRFLVPLLVMHGHEVTVLASGRTPIPEGAEWRSVKLQIMDYRRGGNWQKIVRESEPEVMIDILGTDLPTLYHAVKDICSQLIACGSVWMFGPAKIVPTPPETQGPCEFEGYRRRYEELHQVREEARGDGISFTALMPPNICGPGKIPLDNLGGRSLAAHRAMARGKEAILPEGCNTLIGPCDAEDIGTAFLLAVQNRERAAGRVLNVGAAYALTAPEFIQTYSSIYGNRIPIRYIPAAHFFNSVLPDAGANFHFRHHMCPDISETTRRLGYHPRFSPQETMERAVRWMRDEGLLNDD